ncbi:MAG TPA: STAS domain-containing protein [Bryobacteraceae bacterium]|nr:STAS domain-containing protein [Bryobacteraceae bacterium]
MSLDLERQQTEGIVILRLRGRLVAGDEAIEFRRLLTEQIEQGNNKAILDLRAVDYIDSTGLGNLVATHSAFEKAGGALKLLNLSKRSAELLILTKLTTVFEMYDDEQAAVNSFFPGREVQHFDILEFVKSEERKEKA